MSIVAESPSFVFIVNSQGRFIVQQQTCKVDSAKQNYFARKLVVKEEQTTRIMAQSNLPVADINAAIRKQLISLLTDSNAHQSFDGAIKDLPAELRGVKPDKLPYSIWQLVDHIRIAQWDILEFSRNSTHQSPPWPDGYWTKEIAPPTEDAWQQALDQIRQDREAFVDLLNDPQNDLYAPFAHGDGQNLLREAILIGDHTAYHVGEIITLRRLLGAWKK